MAYDKIGKDDPILRDYLATERTHLANERTLLAYLRSSLIMLVASPTILKLFEGDPEMKTMAFILAPIAILVGIFGIYRFVKTRNKIIALGRKR